MRDLIIPVTSSTNTNQEINLYSFVLVLLISKTSLVSVEEVQLEDEMVQIKICFFLKV